MKPVSKSDNARRFRKGLDGSNKAATAADGRDTLQAKGSYCLILFAPKSVILSIGKLGKFHFTTGYYAYVGSAYGPGGLAARLRHHLKQAKRPHWHIDYLRPKARIIEIWFDYRAAEHAWAEALGRLAGIQKPVKGFGCSDCRCFTHLFFFASKPIFSNLKDRFGGMMEHKIKTRNVDNP